MSTKIASSGSVHVFTAPQSKNADVLTLDESKLTTQETSNLQTLMVDDLVRQRAHHHPNHRVVSYPSSGISFVDYTLQQLDIFAWRVAKHYAKWLPPRRTSSQMPEVIGLLGPSNFEYLITLLALTKLGHSVLLLSTRITIAAVESLIKQTASNALIAHERCNDTAKAIGHLMPDVDLLDIAQRSIFEFGTDGDCDTRMTPLLDPGQEQNYIAFIIHSSGSTGLPKPIYQTHKACLANYATGLGMKGFITLPLYHNHGICNFFRALHSTTSLHIYNADLPLATEHLVTILRQHKFEVFYGVPYALKLLSESAEGVELLRNLKITMYGGSACPEELGNKLVKNGVNIVSHYGATEVGQLMTSFRPKGDTAWNYVREPETLTPYLRWIDRGGNLYECCIRDGWPSKVQSNQPDGSYATKDLFEAHPTIPRAWKYVARLDDTIVLVNGEKFNPVAMEGSIRSNVNVAEAVVFGAGRPFLGLLVVPSRTFIGEKEDAILDAIWPIVDTANQNIDAFAKISKNMIRLLPPDFAYPQTDKGSIIRQKFYQVFQKEIDETYDGAERSGSDVKKLSPDELSAFLHNILLQKLPDKLRVSNDTDFFELGLDSLQAIQMRSDIIKVVDVGGNRLGQNLIFDYPSIAKLSSYLTSLSNGMTGETILSSTVEQEMHDLMEKYALGTNTEKKANGKGTAVVLTGATGSLGAHVAAKLAINPQITTIYCLVRASDKAQAAERIDQSLSQRRIQDELAPNLRAKLVALPSDLGLPKLGLADEEYDRIANGLCAVIHCAWSVNFSMKLSSFENGNIAGVANLIALCQASRYSATMNFCSSVSTCSRATSVPVPETLPDLAWAQSMGYAQSKSVAEHLCCKAADRGVTARVLRIGQIVGDTRHGVWNAQEAIPMMLQTAKTVGALPRIAETPSWLPVDVTAEAVVDISLSNAGSIVTNITNPLTFDWVNDLLPALHRRGLRFDEVEPNEWVRLLRASNQDPSANPPIKLVEFFASKYDKTQFESTVVFATEQATSLSPALSNAPSITDGIINKFMDYFESSSW